MSVPNIDIETYDVTVTKIVTQMEITNIVINFNQNAVFTVILKDSSGITVNTMNIEMTIDE